MTPDCFITVDKFRRLKSKTNGSNSILVISIANAIGIAYMCAWTISIQCWVYFGTFESLDPLAFELSIHFPNIFFAIICLTILDKITHGMLIINQIGQKLVFSAIQKFDLWWWRKFRTQGPLSRGIFRAQQNMQSLSVYRRRQIILAGAAVCGVWYLHKLGMI